ncbi:MAG: glycosyltransferase family 2 protein [Chloroflexaceae bacterium]|nr:glycosyltransferase family 2 protein [Chloroflexaceae bacterium]NJL34506.1 glycosyltransferase family 2 protein [Chloroflexaceae bacterium]NJO04792.1 glycosyltransferase family 2 protein [Chloroflexaceae bacterium]
MIDATLSLVLPVRDAAPVLAPVVRDCLRLVPRHFTDCELIIVDDGSRDTTLEVARQLAIQHDPVLVLQQPAPRGYGRALRYGLQSARGDYLLALHSDGGVHIGELARLLPYIEQHRLLTGYRLQQPPRSDRVLQGLVTQLISPDLRDPACLFMLLHASLLRELPPLTATGMLIHTELYARARQQQHPCIQVGVQASQPVVLPGASYGRVRADTFGEVARLALQVRGLSAAGNAGPSWSRRAAYIVGLAALARLGWEMVRRK